MLGTGKDMTMANAIYRPPIGDDYWDNPTNLWENIDIPEQINYQGEDYKVTSIAPYAFYQSTEVKNISLPQTIRSMGTNAFYWCVNLTTVNIPDGITKIEANTFNNCRSLQSIEIPQGIVSIGGKAFFDCKGLTEIVIPGSCTEIETDAFSWCTNIKSLTFADSNQPLKISYAYAKSVYYEGSDTDKRRGLFADSPLSTVYIGRNIISPTSGGTIYPPFKCISNYCTNTTGYQGITGKNFDQVQFGNKVTEIPEELFSLCNIESTLSLPDKLESIGKKAFYSAFDDLSAQTEIVFPETLKSIGESAFADNSDIRFFYLNCATPPDLPVNQTDGPFVNCDFICIVPTGSGTVYRNHEVWKNYNIVAPDDPTITVNVKTQGSLYSRLLAQDIQLADIKRIKLTGTLNSDDWAVIKQMSELNACDLLEITNEEIPDGIFSKKESLMEIKLPQGITGIGASAFENCYHLIEIEVPPTCQNIGKSAFGNTSVKKVSLAGNAVNIGTYAFWKCKNLKELRLYGEGTVVNPDAFRLNYIEKLYIGKGVEIGTEAFSLSQRLEEVEFEDGVKKLASNIFGSYPNSIKKTTFNGSVELIEETDWGTNVEEVHITDAGKWCSLHFPTAASNPLYRAEHLFLNGTEVSEIDIPADITSIGDYTFMKCATLKKVTLPNSLTTIGKQAFSGCSSLLEINFPPELSEIGTEAFESCKSLNTLDFPQSITAIGEKAFANCTSLKQVFAHWHQPVKINPNVFTTIPSDSYLYIPILTAAQYRTNGWQFPNMQESGTLTITANTGGYAIFNEEQISNKTQQYTFRPYTTLSIEIITDEGYDIRSVLVNDEEKIQSVIDGLLTIEEPEEDVDVCIEFTQATAAPLILDEKNENLPQQISDHDGDTKDVFLLREFKTGGWNTLCLPFEVSIEELHTLFGTGTKVATFSNPMENVVNFSTCSAGSIEANTPFIISISQPTSQISFVGKTIIAPHIVTPVKKGEHYIDFMGTYESSLIDEGDYFIMANSIYRSIGTTKIEATRAFIHDGRADIYNANEVRFYIDAIETNIMGIHTEDQADMGRAYRPDGIPTDEHQKGIIIKKGKKYINQ